MTLVDASAKPECIWPVGAKLGEGPIWSAREQAVWFVDIKGRRIHRYEERTGQQRSWNTPEDIGFIVPATGQRFICGLKSGLYQFDPASGEFTLITRVDSDRPNNRLNDGYVDAAGRLWFGTMDDGESRPTGALYRFDSRGLQRCDDSYVITNGPAVSPDGRTLYHVDTLKRLIYAFDLDDSGALSNRRVFVNIEVPDAYPDGPAADATGCLWVGLYGGRSVRRYSPTAKLPESIALPVSNCTKVAFGGEDLRTLYITTAWKGLSDEQRREQPLAGGLFRVRVPVPGLTQHEVNVRL
jgi:xylono-1,5-lactonase